MKIQVFCPNGHKLGVPESMQGKRIHCPKCQAMVLVPQSSESRIVLSWFVKDNTGKKYGPISDEMLMKWYFEGRLAGTYIQQVGHKDWVRPDSVLGGLPKPPSVNSQNNKVLVQQLARDNKEILPFIKEMMMDLFYEHPFLEAVVEIDSLVEELDSITDDKIRAQKVGDTLKSIAEIFKYDYVKEWQDCIIYSIQDFLLLVNDEIRINFREYRHYLTHKLIVNQEKRINSIMKDLNNIFIAKENSIDNLVIKFGKICQLYPKWRSTMTRSPLLDWTIDFLERFLSGSIGMGYGGIYEDWRADCDTENIENFCNLLGDWEDSLRLYLQRMELSLSAFFHQVLCDVKGLWEDVSSGIYKYACKGKPIQDICKAMRLSKKKLASVDFESAEDIIRRLREKGISYKTECNIRSMLGMS